MKAKVLRRINAVIAAILSFLGFSSCDRAVSYGPPPEPSPVMYGVPSVEYYASGKVTNKKGEPLQNINIQIKKDYEGEKYNIIESDRIYTNQEGKWNIEFNYDNLVSSENNVDSLWIFAIDTTAAYLPDSTKVEITIDHSKAYDWVIGTCTFEQDFQLKLNEEK